VLLRTNVSLDLQSTIRVLDLGSLRFFEAGPTGERELPGAPPVAQIFVRPREGTPDRKEMLRLLNVLGANLERSADRRMTVTDAEQLLTSSGFSKTFVDGVIRTYVGTGMLRAKKDKSGSIQLSLSNDTREAERRRHYSSGFASDLKAQSEQLGRLIAHGPTVGTGREELLRALLERHVPGRYHVATGFVDGFKPQFDILIYDQIDFAPIFRSGNLVVAPPEAVRALIEVKSTLDASNIDDALAHLDVVTFMSMGRPPLFRGIFAFSGIGSRAIAKAVRHHHRQFTATTPIDDDGGEPIVSIDQMVTGVCVLEKALVRTGFASMPAGSVYPWMPVTVSVASEAGYASQAGAFFDLVDRFLRYPYEGPFDRGSLMDIVRDDMVTSDLTPLYEDEDWANAFFDEDGPRVGERIAAYRDWLAGEPWRPEDPSWDEE
jgi:hypothetical protein